jgi:PadR family transcriptional regulator
MSDGAAPNLLPGTLDLLVLKALSLQPLHGLGVARRIEQISRGTFQVGAGSLFPALHRLEAAGAVRSSWGASANNRRAKFYRLTGAGARQLARQTGEWRRVAAAMMAALDAG